ncbi:DNA polymerase zeta catalytic subunit Rev3 [Schizosaccharomyces cryophilus OY26]|uniref:DNA polymerase n=1 Tax=Schizosaccharomyces cryophilus (strain OY26 / ATCC MYA-4695 / CBS 11777 / NBRC 106824 / NRRL Y48691) TaxID=653667 RepID=S9W6C9_SCHCR|nr:DNA polymerase zeta catalytic subunit Rev3 [Schizosaccharomyces cryophilus OY26]EPY53375.1 DNA polymerase zeta catalytic subunit Rev3 [Schizosaccharomyces cryophilus OY26]
MNFSLEYIDWELEPYDPSYDDLVDDLDNDEGNLPLFPVIRIFGINENSETVCCFLHNVFPYLYVEYSDFSNEIEEQGSITTFLNIMHLAIHHALALAARAQPEKYRPSVQSVQLVKGIPFYGYNVGYRRFLKIALYSPKNRDRLVDLFRQGAILNKVIQVYESHLPYLLQFMVDYNLYGCAPIQCNGEHLRASKERKSYCELEFHMTPQAILNSDYLVERNLHSSLVEPSSAHDSLLITSLSEIWKSEAKRRNVISTDETVSFSELQQTQLSLKATADNITRCSPHWKNEDQLKKDFAKSLNEASRRTFQLEPLNISDPWPEVPTVFVALHFINPTYSSQSLASISQLSSEDRQVSSNIQAPSQEKMKTNNVEVENSFEQLDSELERIMGDSIFESFPFVQPNSDLGVVSNSSSPPLSESPLDSPKSSPPSLNEAYRVLSSPLNSPNSNLRLKGGGNVRKRPVELIASSDESSSSSRPLPSSNPETGLVRFQKYRKPPINFEEVTRWTQLPKEYYLPYKPRREEYIFAKEPPSHQHLIDTLVSANLPTILYPYVHYSLAKDIPSGYQEYLGNIYYPRGITAKYLQDFHFDGHVEEGIVSTSLKLPSVKPSTTWEYALPPPTLSELNNWSKQKQIKTNIDKAPSASQRKVFSKDPYASIRILSLELFCSSKNGLLPDPSKDPVESCFWAYQENANIRSIEKYGFIVNSPKVESAAFEKSFPGATVLVVFSEIELLNEIISLTRQLDPTILCGYEVHNSSWGYLIERAAYKFNYDLPEQLSRLADTTKGAFAKKNDAWHYSTTSSIKIVGRHMLNIWRIMRGEINLLNYSLENVVAHLFGIQTPFYRQGDLVQLWSTPVYHDKHILFQYMLKRTKFTLEILSSRSIITKIREQARVVGIDFMSVISRGSQFKVEAIMFRIAKSENYVLVSPSAKQVAEQNALEALPLVLEPKSNMYHNPVLVLDFQSLYPSIIIAYNLCYSTCLGPIRSVNGKFKLGFMSYSVDPRVLDFVRDNIYISPNGYAYVNKDIRKSLIAKMLEELIETRAMIKKGMKECDSAYVYQILDSRQLALKLIANVTYGYTSASFSGRMPCSEIADTIVETGRELLGNAISYINNHESYNAKVVYGDTDSLFVELPGQTKEQAFEIGHLLASEITSMYPSPIRLKFEKVYLPCFLLAKKRYVGYKYEKVSEAVPSFDAKGIETVRRDGTPIQQKILRSCIEKLFQSKDLSQVKKGFQEVCSQIMSGEIPAMDFCYNKEVRMDKYKELSTAPPGASMARRLMTKDPRSEPQYGERVPYLVIAGAPGTTLANRSVSPEEYLLDSFSQLDIDYYIRHNLIPPLDRFLNLLGASAESWYNEMPKRLHKLIRTGYLDDGSQVHKKTLDKFLTERLCSSCLRNMVSNQNSSENKYLCDDCLRNIPAATTRVIQQSKDVAVRLARLEDICRGCSCISSSDPVLCRSKSCKIYYDRAKTQSKAKAQAELYEKTFLSLDW